MTEYAKSLHDQKNLTQLFLLNYDSTENKHFLSQKINPKKAYY